REGKGFSRITTPLFETMMVQAPEEVGEKNQKSRRTQRKETEVPHTEPQTEESVPITSNDLLPSDEDTMQLIELMNLCTNLQKQEDASKQERMIDSIDQDVDITLVDETQGRVNEEDMFKVNDLDGDEVIMDVTVGENVEQSTKDAEKEVSTADPVTTVGEVVTTTEDVEVTTAATTPQISKDELTLAHTLIEIKAAKPKARGVIV
nr:hypothetical protein [Tanacetum cinerariifolium]